MALPLAGVVALCLVAVIVPLRMGLRRIEAMEF